jgi:regulatory protein
MTFRARKLADEASLYDYALSALGRKMRSVAELKRLLRARVTAGEGGEAMVEAVVARLKEHGYLNDTSYAAAYSTYRKENEKFGRRRVISDLKTRGVHRDVIDKAIADAYSGTNEEQLARAFLRRRNLKKPASQKEAARIFRALMRAGFSGGTAVRILKKWDVDDEVLALLESEQG